MERTFSVKKLFSKVRFRSGEKSVWRQKLEATAFGITLGAFGVHRLYLGTSAKVPVFYTLTLGGGIYIIPAVDMILILSTKDLDKYKNNPKVIMW